MIFVACELFLWHVWSLGFFKRPKFSHKSCCQTAHVSHLGRLIIQLRKQQQQSDVEVSHHSKSLEGRIRVLWIIPQSKSHVCVFIPLWRILWGLNFTSARWASTLVQKRSIQPRPSQHCACMYMEIKVVPCHNFYCILGPVDTTQHSYFLACTLFSMATALTVYFWYLFAFDHKVPPPSPSLL